MSIWNAGRATWTACCRNGYPCGQGHFDSNINQTRIFIFCSGHVLQHARISRHASRERALNYAVQARKLVVKCGSMGAWEWGRHLNALSHSFKLSAAQRGRTHSVRQYQASTVLSLPCLHGSQFVQGSDRRRRRQVTLPLTQWTQSQQLAVVARAVALTALSSSARQNN